MSVITFLLSALLIAGGGYALISGFDIVTTERGLALTLCGTMALSIGVVVLALGFILVRLGKLKFPQPALNSASYSDVSPDFGLRSDLPDEISANLSEMKAATMSNSSNPAGSPTLGSYKTAGALAAGAGVMAAGAGVASAFDFGDKPDQQEHPVHKEPEHLALDGIEAVKETVVDEIPVFSPDLKEALVEEPVLEPDDTFADLDKLIDELAVETSITAYAATNENVKTPDVQIIEQNIPENSFESELRTHNVNHEPLEDTSVEHVLLNEDAEASEVKDPEPEIIGAYDSGGVTYTLYSDGGVVAEAGDQREQYSSLEKLKAALENGTSVFKS